MTQTHTTAPRPQTADVTPSPILPELASLIAPALDDLRGLFAQARDSLSARVTRGGRIDPAVLEQHQHAAHALSWLATYVESLAQMAAWHQRLAYQGKAGLTETLILQIAFGEYCAQVFGGIPMAQGEFARLSDLGLHDVRPSAATARLIDAGNTDDARRALAGQMSTSQGMGTIGQTGLDDDMDMIRDQFRRFAQERVVPHAHGWHLNDELIPMQVISEMADLGVFGLTIPEEYGGFGMGKTAMCVVSEELSRGYIGVGSLGTRSEIAAELILTGGTEAQKAHWLPLIASGQILPTAVFTEPNTGSDLGALATRATRDGDSYVVTGNKTWITHAARADLMTLLVRTDPGSRDHRGLSMLLAPKPRGTDAAPFPAPGMSGGEIGVLGYRGMKEYEIGFDGFRVDAGNLLGSDEGQGFRQLMQTFESARIQTAARANGVAQAAMELGLAYAETRKQFGKPLSAFPRIHGKLAMMATEIMIARQLTYHSASTKDQGLRCDLQAGMAKLLGARVAWAAADNALQIHGGNGFAMEYPISRVLCDARILNIFEGAAEIQAQVIARRLLE